MSFRFWFAWALFIVFQKTTSRMPWPIKHFLLSQFSDEFEAQRRVLNQRSVQNTGEVDAPKSIDP